ncbi:MAG: xanthine dehydrogenase accessory protein XdhC [Geminicoccaceae bacterium]
MLVTREGMAGTIGGGELEWQALAAARRMLADPSHGTETAGTSEIVLGPQSGQCCGGRATFSIRMATERDIAKLEKAERGQLLGHLMLFGAGHVGRAVARAVEPLAIALHWFDERADMAAAAAPCRHAANPLAEVANGPAGSAWLVMTHSHARDFELCSAILQRDDFDYLGLIGSATKRARFEKGLRELGLDGQHLVCPVGGGDVNDKRPEVIAALTVAELIRAMTGRTRETGRS